jgi:recombination protein RecA
MNTEKLEKMQFIVTETAKKYGKEKVKYGIDVVPKKSTGSVHFDYLLNGGYEEGTIAIFFGPSSSGKTTLSLRNIAEAQKRGDTCAWLRVEKGANRQYMEKIGVDVDNLLVIEGLPNGEAYLDTLIRLIEEEVDMIVVDSLSALIPQREMDESLEREHPGLQAKLITRVLGKANAINKKSIIIFISQIRQAFTTGYIKYNFAGGFAAQHHADYIVEFKLKEKLDADGKEIGSGELKTEDKNDVEGVNMLMYVQKCRRGLAHKAGEMQFNLKTGKIDAIGELIRVAIKLNVIAYSGGWVRLTDEFKEMWKFQSNSIRHSAMKEEVEKNPELEKYIKDRIAEHYDN